MVHLFLNCDDYLTSLKVAELKRVLGNPEFIDLNCVELGERSTAPEILAQASMMPFLSERRMVIVTGCLTAFNRRLRQVQRGDGGAKTASAASAASAAADKADRRRTGAGPDAEGAEEGDENELEAGAPARAGDGAVYAEIAAFFQGLRQVPEETDLLLIDALDDRAPLWRGFRLPTGEGDAALVPGLSKLGKESGFIEHRLRAPANSSRDSALTDWILREAQQRNIRIERDAADCLAQFVGGDLRRVVLELDKLSLFRPGQPIVERQVRAQVADTSEERYFALTDALVARNGRVAFTVLADLWRAGENPFGLLAAIASAYRNILRAKALMQQGVREPKEMAKALGLREEWQANKVIKAAGRFLSYSELEEILQRCFDANMAMISGEDQATQIELLVAELTLTPHRRAA